MHRGGDVPVPFLELAEQIGAVLWLATPDRRQIEYVSPSFERLWGISPEAIRRDPSRFFESIHSDDRERVQQAIAEQRTGKSECTYRIVRPDGAIRWMRSRTFPVPGDDGGEVRVAGITEDVTGWKQAERARAESEQRFVSLAEHSGAGIWIITAEGHTEYANPAMCRMLEVDGPDSLRGRTYHEFFTDASVRKINAEQETRRSGFASSYEVELVGARGGHRQVIIHGAPLQHEDGSFRGRIGTLTDVTELKRHQTLLASEARARDGLARAVQRLSRCRATGEIVEVIRSTTRELIGADGVSVVLREGQWCHYVAEDAIGPLWKGCRFPMDGCISGWSMRHGEVAVIDDVDADERVPQEAYRKTFVRSLVMAPIVPDEPRGALGAYWSQCRSPAEQEIGIIRALADATAVALANVRLYEDLETARRTAEHRAEELAIWKRRYDAAINASHQIFYDWDLRTDRVVWGGPLAETLDVDPTDIVGTMQWWRRHVLPEDLARFDHAVAAAAERGDEIDAEYRVHRRGDEQRVVHQRGSLFAGESGDGSRIIGFIMDVTDRRALEEQLRQSQKMEAIGQLAGGVAHDFNNLLLPILCYTGMALSGSGGSTELRTELETIHHAANRAKELTRQLLAFGRRQVLQAKPLSMSDEIRGVADMLRRVIRENVQLDIQLDPDLGCVVADPTQMQQLLMNLAINAQDAMPEGGSLRIEAHNVTLGQEEAARRHVGPGEYVQLIVRDSGVGMDEETRLHIFEPFFTTKGAGQGTGLGLATAHGLVRQHDGDIQCTSRPGEGACFDILLPRTGSIPGQTPPSPPLREEQHDEVVLVVDDDPMVRDITCKILQRAGYQVLAATGGQEAQRVAEAHAGAIDLLLTDVVMPGADGREVYMRLREIRPEMRVLFMSGYAGDVIARHGVGEGRVVQKPFEVQELLGQVRRALDSR